MNQLVWILDVLADHRALRYVLANHGLTPDEAAHLAVVPAQPA